MQQHPVRHAPRIGPAGWAQRGERLMPGGTQVRGGRDGLRPDRLGRVAVAGQFPPGADGGGPALPVQPVHRVRGDRTQGGGRPGELMLGGVLADPVLAGVHQRGDLGQVRAACGVGDGGDLGRPRARRGRDDGAGPVPEPGVDDGGHVAGPGQVPLADRGGQHLPGVQPGQLRRAQGPPQPPGLVARLSPVFRRQAGQEQIPVVLLAGRGDLVGPDRVQDRQVISVGQGTFPGLGRGQLLAISVQHAGQHCERVPGLGRLRPRARPCPRR